MRTEAEEDARASKEGSDVHGPPDFGNFGFHYPLDYVVTAVQILEASSWVCWPEGKGWANESAELIGDVFTYLRLRRRMRWEVEHGTNSRYEESADDAPKINLSG